MIDFFAWGRAEPDPNRLVRQAAYQREMEQLEQVKKQLDHVIDEFDQTMDGLRRGRR